MSEIIPNQDFIATLDESLADLPKDIHTLTLSYTLFDVSAVSQQAVALAPTPNSAKTRSGT